MGIWVFKPWALMLVAAGFIFEGYFDVVLCIDKDAIVVVM